MKKIFNRLARFFVIVYANRIYKQRVKLADKLHAKYRTRMYVCMPFGGKELIIMDRKGFRMAKELQHIRNPKLSTLCLKDGSYYYTANAAEKDAMTPKEMELRRLSFLNYMLRRAKLRA